MTFSLILCTYGRAAEGRVFLESLARQECREFELIVVDQNPDDRFADVLNEYRPRIPVLKYLRADRPGLSMARNLGLPAVTGDIVAFPDDDCHYPPDLLAQIMAILDRRPNLDGVAGTLVDQEDGRPLFFFRDHEELINRENVWFCSTSATIFFRTALVRKIGLFDTNLGVGAPYGSGEDIDYVLRGIAVGGRILYDPAFRVHHPNDQKLDPERKIRRGYTYGLGYGYLLRKHHLPFRTCLRGVLRPLGGILLRLIQGNGPQARFHWSVLKGRIHGWMAKQ